PRGLAGAAAELVEDLLRALEAEAVLFGLAHAEPAVGVSALGTVAGRTAQRVTVGVWPRAVGEISEIAGATEGASHLVHHLLAGPAVLGATGGRCDRAAAAGAAGAAAGRAWPGCRCPASAAAAPCGGSPACSAAARAGRARHPWRPCERVLWRGPACAGDRAR